MKILLISNMYPSKESPYAGIYVKNQYEYIKNNLQQDIDILAMPRKHTSKLGSIYKYLKFVIASLKILKSKYDILHVHFLSFHFFIAVFYKLKYPDVKIVLTVHGSDVNLLNIKSLQYKLLNYAIHKAKPTVIAVGSDLAKSFQKKFDLCTSHILSAGIDEKTFYNDKDIEKLFDYIFVGSFYNIKGVDIFIDSIKKLNKKDIKYCFVGSGKYLNDINELSNHYDITLIENQSQNKIRILLNQSKWLVLPSRGDSFGLVVSEAIFCGTPAIVSNINGMKDQVKDGVNGFILKENTPECLAQKIEELMKIENDQYDTLRKNAISSNKKYSMSIICNTLLNIYEDIMNEK